MGNRGCRKPFSENSNSQKTTSSGPKRQGRAKNSSIKVSKLLVLFNSANFLIGNQVIGKLNFDTDDNDISMEVGITQVQEAMEYLEVVVCNSLTLNIYEY